MKFFDPGLAAEPFEGGFRPDGLPLDPKTATALINDCINFGQQFKDPAEMAWFGAQTADDFYEGSSMSIQAQLTRQFSDIQGAEEEREQNEARSKAQFILLLAWFLEERMMEVAGLEQGVKDSWKSMDQTLGVEDDDRLDGRVVTLGTAESHTGGASDGQAVPFPWKRVAEALPGFIPADSILVCADPEIIAAWEERDIAFHRRAGGHDDGHPSRLAVRLPPPGARGHAPGAQGPDRGRSQITLERCMALANPIMNPRPVGRPPDHSVRQRRGDGRFLRGQHGVLQHHQRAARSAAALGCRDALRAHPDPQRGRAPHRARGQAGRGLRDRPAMSTFP